MNNSRIKLELKGSCLKREDKAAYTPKELVNFLIVYKLDSWHRNLGTDLILGGCLFGGVKITKNVDSDKYSYTDYDTEFNTAGEYSLPDGNICENIIIFGVDMSSSVRNDNKGKDILILCKGPTQGLNRTLTLVIR